MLVSIPSLFCAVLAFRHILISRSILATIKSSSDPHTTPQLHNVMAKHSTLSERVTKKQSRPIVERTPSPRAAKWQQQEQQTRSQETDSEFNNKIHDEAEDVNTWPETKDL